VPEIGWGTRFFFGKRTKEPLKNTPKKKKRGRGGTARSPQRPRSYGWGKVEGTRNGDPRKPRKSEEKCEKKKKEWVLKKTVGQGNRRFKKRKGGGSLKEDPSVKP